MGEVLPPIWDPEEDDVLVCRQVRQETHDVKTFVFAARKPALFKFDPGQFLTFDLTINGTAINRCYTISSPPTRPYTATISVKRVAGGPVSNWLHDNLRPGMEIRAVGPMGVFTPQADDAKKYLFLSGGSGITPLMSMSRYFHDLAEPVDIVFVHSARSPADIIFRQELALLEKNMHSFRAVAICEADSDGEKWGGYRGRLSAAALKLIAPDFLQRSVFTCGPSPYMAAVREMLKTEAYPMDRYHEESFSFEDLSPAETVAPVASGECGFRVEFAKSGRVIEVAPDGFILEAARAAGLRLPSSCTQGLCGTCKSKLVSGTVDMKHQGGIRQREIDQGQILICCSKPTSDLVIDR